MNVKRQRIIPLAVLILLCSGLGSADAMSRKPPGPDNAAQRIMVQFKPDVSFDAAARIIEAEGCEIVTILERSRIHFVVPRGDRPVEETIDRFLTYPEVLYAEPDFKVERLEK